MNGIQINQYRIDSKHVLHVFVTQEWMDSSRYVIGISYRHRSDIDVDTATRMAVLSLGSSVTDKLIYQGHPSFSFSYPSLTPCMS